MSAQLPWLVDLASLVCDMDWWLSGRVLPLQSVVTGLISSGGDHGIRCWWDRIRSKQLSSISVYCAQVFAGFSARVNSIHSIIPLLKIENVHLFPSYSEIMFNHSDDEADYIDELASEINYYNIFYNFKMSHYASESYLKCWFYCLQVHN